VTNVIRHSRASRCEIAVRREDGVAELEVRDDGAGGAKGAGEGSGLRGLSERMAEAGGTLDAGPADGGGFRLVARVPIATSTHSRSRGGAGRDGPMIRILIAEDQGMVRGALAALLAFEPDLEVVAEVSAGAQVLAAAREHRPDIALLDIEMPRMDGIDAAAALRREVPDCTPLILTTFGRPAYLRRAMEAGAAGFLVKDAPAERLANAIRRAAAGERVVDPELAAAALADGESPLTPREREVLEAGADGSPVSEIAERLHLSEGTVRNYLSTAIGKTGARNRVEAWRVARERD
jgi:two-component system response regulator DesR